MKRIATMAAVMTPFPHSVDVHAGLRAAVAAMREHEVRHLPVTDGGTLVGVVAERDILPLLDPKRRGKPSEDFSVSDVCVRDALIVDIGDPLDTVLFEMAEGHFDSVLVVKRGRLAGIFTVSDACKRFGEFLRDQVRPSGGDDAA